MSRLFDAYIIVDWSAASKPATGPNSIWVGVLAKDARLKFQYRGVNIATRLEARAFILDMVQKLNSRGDRILLGFDFSLGYPAGTAAALGLDIGQNPPWQAMHQHLSSKLKDKPDNSNARFAIAAGMNYAISKGAWPFWGVPARDAVSTLGTKKAPAPSGTVLNEWRQSEIFLKKTKRGNPKSVWQLAYVGSVGSQSLMGIPHVHALRAALPTARIWPFETGFKPLSGDQLDGVQTVIAEVYPSVIKPDIQQGEIPDAAQVRAMCGHYCDLDETGKLGPAFGPPKGLDSLHLNEIEGEEGWILGG